MPRNNKKSKQRALDLESNEDTVISNLAANEENLTQMDRLKSLQEMFVDKIEPDLVRDVFHECAGNAEQTLETLLEMFDSNQFPTNDSFPTLDRTIEEVPHLVSEPPLNVSTNSNTEYLSRSTTDPNVEVLNKLPVNAKANHVSALNAVMPFANLFAPKPHNHLSNIQEWDKSSQLSSKHKEFSLKNKIIEIIRSNKEKVLVLMRGLPGSGKTTLAHSLVKFNRTSGLVLSTDDYFSRNGFYRFDATQLPTAHEWNQKRAKQCIQSGRTPIIIDNTNLEIWEMKPYVSYGHLNGYQMFILEPDTHWNRNIRELSKRNIHGIPRERIEIMAQRFERVTIEYMIRSLQSNSFSVQKSNSEEKIHKNLISTNGLKQIVLRSSSSPSAAISSPINSNANNSDYAESPHSSQTSVSAQIEDMTNNSQIERNSSSSPVSTEPTSPLTDTQIDIDLLLALNQRNADSEDCSSINASDGSSCVSQESGWEKDDEFTYTHNITQETVSPECNDDNKPSVNGVNVLKTDNNLCSNSEPKPKRESKSRDQINEYKQMIEEEDCTLEGDFPPWDSQEYIKRDNFIIDAIKMSAQKINDSYYANNGEDNKYKKCHLLGVRMSNWEFPAFPIDNSDNSDSGQKEILVSCLSRQTQTERKDWALLELKRNKDSNEGLETESSDREENIIESKVDPSRNLLKVTLHKGTYTSDIPDDMTRDQKLSTLRQKFPKAEDNHLNEILDACLEDDKWAEKLLSELDDNHFDVGNLEQLSTSTEPSVSSPEIDSESLSTEDEEPFEVISDQKSSDEPEFTLTLDPLLAAQLQSHFGCLSDNLSAEDLTITLSHGVARLLHHNWKKSLNQKSLNRMTTKTQSINNSNNYINLKNKNIRNEKTIKPLVLEQNTPKSELQEIMDLELAKVLSRQEYDESLAADANNAFCPTKRRMAKQLLSTKLKRDQLYQRYPGVDQSFLDTIFESNNYELGKTIGFLDNSLGLNVDFSKETEALIADERFGSPMSGSSRSASPSKPVRKTIDIKAVLSEMNSDLEKKKEYHDKARLAFHRKMFAVASYYGEEATNLQKKIERLSAEIVDSILTNCSNSNELDLHGLHIKEVNSILSEYLRRKSDELRKTSGKRKLIIDIITGYGATKGIQGTIKPTVIQYLKQKGLTYEMVNMGVIRVTLTQ